MKRINFYVKNEDAEILLEAIKQYLLGQIEYLEEASDNMSVQTLMTEYDKVKRLEKIQDQLETYIINRARENG